MISNNHVIGRLIAELEPGDAIYIPKSWWHQVEAMGSVNMLVNVWWDGFAEGLDQPYTKMLLAMIAIAEGAILAAVLRQRRPIAPEEAAQFLKDFQLARWMRWDNADVAATLTTFRNTSIT